MKKNLLAAIIIILLSGNVFSQTNWTPVSPNFFPTNASGQIHGLSRVSQVKFHPTNSNKVYAVSSRGGLFISSNAGTTWTLAPGCDILPQMRLNSVCIDYTNDQTIYLGTGDANYYYTGSGVYKSTNGGTTFSPTTLTGRLIVEILMDPTNNNVLIAATDAGIYKTTNGGTSWTLKTSNVLDCRDMVFKANSITNTKVIFASTYSNFYRSTDMGDTWTQITSGLYFPSGSTTGGGCRIAVTPADSNIVYFSMVARSGTIFKSSDGGTTFVNVKDADMPNLTAYDNVSGATGQGDYNSMFAADPVNVNTLYYGSHNFWKSTDGGANWTQMTNWWAVLHTDMHWVKVNPYNTSQIWTANDGGVWVSTNGGSNWTPKSDGIYGIEIYHGNCSPTRRDMFSIGTQDNGELYRSVDTWYCNRGGDWGSQCAFDYRPSSSMVYYYQNDRRRLVNGGDATYGLPVSSLQDIAFYRGYTNLAFAGNLDVYRTTNLLATTPTWTQISSINKNIKAIHVNLSDSNRVYVITSDATIYVSTNALSATPTFTSYPLPNSSGVGVSITSIKSAPNVLYVALNTRVYRSSNNGATWSDVTSNLPSINYIKIISDEYFSGNELVFVAGNTGVYYKRIGQSNWTLFSNSLPTRTTINDFSVYDDGTNLSMLRVSEYGRGMWEVPMTSIRTVTSAFISNTANPCVGTSVQYSDQSTGSVTSWFWTFPGGTPASSTLQNPTVQYNTPGIYNVTLLVSDGTSSNSLTKTSYINTNGGGLPLNEGFESGIFLPANWSFFDDGNDGTNWISTAAAGGFGVSTNSVWFDNFAVNVNGMKDEIRSPRFDLTGLNTAQLTFDVAYQPYNTTNYSDTLQVLISTDCGANFTSVYLKGGGTLSTVAGVTTNAFVPTAGQWRTETINLNGYISSGSLIVSFKNLGHYGNNLYLDNIAINATLTTNAGTDKTICNGAGVAIGSSAVSGVSYLWSPSTGLNSAVSSNPTASPTVNTTYVLTATKTGSTIVDIDTVIVSIDSVPISSSVTDASCFGGSDGAIDLTYTIGTLPYSYLWNNNATTQDRTALPAGSYSVTITNGSSCTRSYSFSVAQPTAVSASFTTTTAKCNTNNGSATATGIGGTPPYTYSWNNGALTAVNSNLFQGTYTVFVTDSRGCTGSATATVSLASPPVINTFVATPSSVCAGVPFSLSFTAAGGLVVNSFSSGAANIAIPDNTPAGVNNTISVNSGIVISDPAKLTIAFNFGTGTVAPSREHTRVGDLKITLTSPGGNTILFDRPGVPASATGTDGDMSGSYVFSATATNILPQTTTSSLVFNGNVVNTSYKPTDSSNPDAAHTWSGLTFPLAVNGNWTINISDNASGDIGDLVSWTLFFSTPYSYVVNGPGTVSPVTCVNGSCSNANVSVTNATPGNQTFTVTATAPDGCTVSSTLNILTTCNVVFNLKSYIQGFYLGGSSMEAVVDKVSHPTLCDTITVELRQSTAPYDIVYTIKDTISTSGIFTHTFPTSILNQSYYIVIHHRNSLETWSKNPVLFNTSPAVYDFTTSANKAFGDNLAPLPDGSFALWSGDVTNGTTPGIRNGQINVDDHNEIENALQGFVTGYKIDDLTGDRIIDAEDFSLIENNSVLFITLMRP